MTEPKIELRKVEFEKHARISFEKDGGSIAISTSITKDEADSIIETFHRGKEYDEFREIDGDFNRRANGIISKIMIACPDEVIVEIALQKLIQSKSDFDTLKKKYDEDLRKAFFQGMSFGRSLAIRASYTPTDESIENNYKVFLEGLSK